MKSKMRNLVWGLLVLAVPTLVWAAGPAGSSGNNLPAETPGLLAQIHSDAFLSEDAAERLSTLDYEYEVETLGWQAHFQVLEREVGWDTEMDGIISRLRSVEGQLPRSQQSQIDGVAPLLAQLDSNTNSAMLYLQNHPNNPFSPKYREYLKDMEIAAQHVWMASATSTGQ